MIRFLLALFLLPLAVLAQDQTTDQARLVSAQSAFDAQLWEEAVRLSSGPEGQSVELDFLRGLALARLEKWDDAKSAFDAGARKTPRDARFPVELAGIAYKQKDFRLAKKDLHRALLLNPSDAYTLEFLATIYLLEGNLQAALKYWNLENKPRLRTVGFLPPPHLDSSLRDRAVAFNAPQVLTVDALRTTESRLDNLDVFATPRTELTPADSGSYDLTLHLGEKNLWGGSKIGSIISLFSGLPYETVYPEIYNLGHRAINITSLARWDDQKRRISVALSMPLNGNPGRRLKLYADARNENWNLSQTFLVIAASPTDLNLRRIIGGAEIRSVVNGNWSWSAGAEAGNRNFRNVPSSLSPGQGVFFTGSNSLAGWLGADRTLARIPERRFTLDSAVQAIAGREFASALGPYATVRGAIRANWFPRAQGDDYAMHAQILSGATAGKASLDELFQLGVERDGDLWLRGHAGTLGGRKGADPLGRRYFLSNWELDKNIYQNGLFGVKLGPFLDNGAIADSSGLFGSQRWQWDSGLQCKVKILGSIGAVFSYGFNLRGGKGVFYGTIPQKF